MSYREFLYKLFELLGWPEQLWKERGREWRSREHLYCSRSFWLHLRCFSKKFKWLLSCASTSLVRLTEFKPARLPVTLAHKKAENKISLFNVAFRNKFSSVGKECSPFGWQVRVQKETKERTMLEWYALRITLENTALEGRNLGILRTMLFFKNTSKSCLVTLMPAPIFFRCTHSCNTYCTRKPSRRHYTWMVFLGI